MLSDRFSILKRNKLSNYNKKKQGDKSTQEIDTIFVRSIKMYARDQFI